ncbi:threonine/serine exporter family protein [Bacterioplanoides pacificum]|uniref:Threonine/serine exporter ThrE family protein n=1 Tax=Bacterioplanoides pacificum TaxID=1171596 RepID=A0ABV7VPH7_9GAMM
MAVNEDEFLIKRKFIIKLGKALHKFGTPAYRLESHLRNVAATLGLEGYFLITPTTMTFVLQRENDQEYNHIARVKPGELDLGSLARCDELVDELTTGQRDLNDAMARLQDIESRPNPYGALLSGSAFTAAAAAFAMLMQTSWNDVLWSALLGLMVYGFVYLAERSPRTSEMLEPLSAIACGVLACLIAVLDAGINIPVVILSGLIIFVPGLALTIGLSELAARDLISGTARVMDAMMLLFKLYFGAVLGMAIGKALVGPVVYLEPAALPDWAPWGSVPVLSMALVIVFKARLKDAFWGILAGAIAFSVAALAGKYFGNSISVFFGALAVGLYASLYSRWMNAPASIALLQGIVILVPGSKSYIGLNAMITGEMMLKQTHLGSQVFLIFMSLVAGLIFANVLMPPRRTL